MTASSPYAHQLFAEVVSLRGVLLGLFFTAVGMLFDPVAAWAQAPEVLAYVVGVVGLKAGLVFIVVLGLLRRGVRVAVLSGLGLAQTGEFSFVLAAAATQAGLLDPEMEQIFLAGSVVTLLATPFLFSVGPRVATLVARGSDALGSGGRRGAPGGGGHVVLVGFGLSGRSLARILHALGIDYVAVESNARTVRELGRRGEPVIYGDATRRPLLERVSVGNARLVIVAITDAYATRQVVRAVRALAPTTPVLARTRYVLEADALYAEGANIVVADEFESTIDLGLKALRSFGVGETALAAFAEALREEGYEPLRAPLDVRLDPWLTELLVEGRGSADDDSFSGA